MTPISYWIAFHVALVVLLTAEYLMAHRVGDLRRKAMYATALWVTASLVLAALLFPRFHSTGTVQYLSAYALEESLSIDNLFVFLLLFRIFSIPEQKQPRVLFWGVAGAIVMRGAFIAAGVGLLAHFHWVSYAFGALLLISAARLVLPSHESGKPPRWIALLRRIHPISERQDVFFVRENGRRMMTVLMLALLAIEVSDVLFATDSIPAVLSITRVPFIAYSSNIMAVMGLRSLYILLAAMLARLRFLHYGLAAVLAFAAVKMLISSWMEIGPVLSLIVIAVLVGITVVVSMIFPKVPDPELEPRT
ncbi:MAG TPA: TerC/Alx family metal homeostasis membrane protein [Candidatus Aquilonibacter sp.]|nr:TerC/Alx family metal homeostasis membrane protein [Candidatus Aquilonibacter sp.]